MTSFHVPCSASGVTNRDLSFILLVFRHGGLFVGTRGTRGGYFAAVV